jgi:GNAT superfamily N-acetyltransferase
MTKTRLVTLAEDPSLNEAMEELALEVWPDFMLEDTVANQYWGRIMQAFSAFQFLLLSSEDEVVAAGNTIPVQWDGTLDDLPEDGWDGMIVRGMMAYEAGQVPNALMALSANIAQNYQGQGLSRRVIEGMKERAIQHGLAAFIAPVRPNQKSLYPLTPIENYVEWRRDDGYLFDAWLRTHQRLGAKVVKIAPQSMTIPGTVAQWEEWTGLRFPESGAYVIPDALNPITIDIPNDSGLYIEPNIWMQHPIGD